MFEATEEQRALIAAAREAARDILADTVRADDEA